LAGIRRCTAGNECASSLLPGGGGAFGANSLVSICANALIAVLSSGEITGVGQEAHSADGSADGV